MSFRCSFACQLAFQSTPDLINRENGCKTGGLYNETMFQSTPDLINRENRLAQCNYRMAQGFQSTPDLINRENLLSLSVGKSYQPVSIHSRFN